MENLHGNRWSSPDIPGEVIETLSESSGEIFPGEAGIKMPVSPIQGAGVS